MKGRGSTGCLSICVSVHPQVDSLPIPKHLFSPGGADQPPSVMLPQRRLGLLFCCHKGWRHRALPCEQEEHRLKTQVIRDSQLLEPLLFHRQCLLGSVPRPPSQRHVGATVQPASCPLWTVAFCVAAPSVITPFRWTRLHGQHPWFLLRVRYSMDLSSQPLP